MRPCLLAGCVEYYCRYNQLKWLGVTVPRGPERAGTDGGHRPQANYRPSCATYLGTLYQMDLGRGRADDAGRLRSPRSSSSSSVAGGHRSRALLTHRQCQSQEKGGDPSVTANAEEPHRGTGSAGEWRPIPDPTKLTTEQLRREVATLREILETRLDGMDRAIALQFTERDVRAEQAAETAPQALGSALSAQKELVAQQNDANSAATAKAEASFTKQIDQIGTIIETMEKATDARITELKQRIDRGEGSTTGAAGSRSERAQVTSQILMMLSVLAAVIGLLILAFRH